ncbi:efflux transporter outer membrane subunit [Desulfotalea psychrophila]|uniref:Probable outer membrane efflux pump channel protein [precursor] n=1 Tax=Desulfotalea psychrophila (strain LSv54 / DSM 12343) TaxID=177439 RepID=Q6AMK0_DESPS|nr:efflux transporter outer membrane subunit [Desulfotalea psychrophila]CAG36425.1 probable outer membrane efflux pump channel protein [precursor] [Desulfotalea psychrophila LSv54]
MKKRYMTLLLAATMLSSCVLIPEYQQPETPTAATWKAGEYGIESEVDTNQLAINIPWQEFFLSESLRDVVQLALDNNKDLQTALLNVEKSRATYNIQRADLFPKINATGSGQFANYQPDGTPAQDLYKAGLTMPSYELDLFGRIQSLSKAALNSYLATEEAQKSISIALIAESANTYLQLISDIESLNFSHKTLKAQKKSRDLIMKRYQYGIATKLDIAQVQIAVETSRTKQALYTRLVQQDKNGLVALLGIKDFSKIPLQKSLQEVALLQEIPVGLPSQILLNRPDIKQAEYQMKGAGANIGAARAAFYPRIALTGELGYASNDLGNLFNHGVWNFGPSISIPVFNAGQNRARLKVAEVEQKIAVTQYEKTIQNAFREVADQLVARDTLGEQLNAQEMLVNASQNAYDLSMMRYTQGIDSFLSALDAQRSLFTAQLNKIDIKRQELANKVSLYKVLGGGLSTTLE